MTPDEIRAAMEDPVAARLLDSTNPARLAYVARDGTPRVVPADIYQRLIETGDRSTVHLVVRTVAAGRPVERATSGSTANWKA